MRPIFLAICLINISFAECLPVKLFQITGSKQNETYNLMGTAVVEAVGLERREADIGPRLFCTNEFLLHLRDTECRQMVVPTHDANVSEVLWPAPYIHREGINGYQRLLEIAINLWQYFGHEDFSVIYQKFVELIVKSIVTVNKNSQQELVKAKRVIRNVFDEKSVDHKFVSYLLDV